MDKKFSLLEFQLYALKNREVFVCLDKFEKLIIRNPIGPDSTMDIPIGIKIYINDEKDDSDDLGEEDDNRFSDNNGDEGYLVNIDEEDEDLLAELNKEKKANERLFESK